MEYCYRGEPKCLHEKLRPSYFPLIFVEKHVTFFSHKAKSVDFAKKFMISPSNCLVGKKVKSVFTLQGECG